MKNYIETLQPDELPDYLKYCESMLRDYDGESWEVRKSLMYQIQITKEAINKITKCRKREEIGT